MKKHEMQIMVEDFMTTFEQEVKNEFKDFNSIDKITKELRLNLIKEEYYELLEGIKNNDIIELADGLGDSLYVAFGTASAYGMIVDIKKFGEIGQYSPEKLISIMKEKIDKIVLNQFWENMNEFNENLSEYINVILLYSIETNIPIDLIFKEIHNSNMSKLDSDLKPIFNENKKIMKGPNYYKPNIKKFFNN